MSCSNNMKQIGLAIHNYASANNGQLPSLLMYNANDGYGWEPFFFILLPYMEQNNLHNQALNSGAGWGNGVNAAVVKTYICPSDPTISNGLCTTGAGGWGASSYAPVQSLFGPNATTIESGQYGQGNNSTGVLQVGYEYPSPYTLVTITDGTSNQVAVVEQLRKLSPLRVEQRLLLS